MGTAAWKKRDIRGSVLERAACASCAYDDRYVLIFGGRQRDTMFLDAWSYDTRTGDLVLLSPGPRAGKPRPRAHHSATLVGDRVWILGGNEANAFCSDKDVWTFDVRSREWAQPRLTGDVALLRRTAHGACPHPGAPGSILLFGGYGPAGPAGGDPLWLGDLVALDTRTGAVKGLRAAGKAPLPRAYHSFTAVGPLAVALFGRTTQQQLIPGPHAVAVYDTRSGKWVTGAAARGEAPPVRSSHRAAALGGGRLAMFGGSAAQPLGHLADMHVLKVEVGPAAGAVTLEWARCQGAAAPRRGRGEGAPWPPPRSAHVMEAVEETLCLLGGYSKTKNYCGDAWEGALAGPASAAASTRPAAAVEAAAAEAVIAAVEMLPQEPDVAAVPWRTTRHARKAAPAAAAPGAAPAAKRPRLSEGSEAMPPPPPAAWAVHPPSGREPAAAAAALMIGAGAVLPCQGPASAAVAAAEAGAAARLAGQLAEARAERERATQDLQAQRAREAELLKALKAADAQAKRLQGQLVSSDESWRAAAAERDAWRQKFEARQGRADNAETRAVKLEHDLATARGTARSAEQHVAAMQATVEQQRRAVEDAAKREAALHAENDGLSRALESREREIAAEKELRTTLAEQNEALVAQRDGERRRREHAEGEVGAAREEARRAVDAAGAEADRQRAAAAAATAAARLAVQERDKATDRAARLEEEVEAAKVRAIREEARARKAEEERAATAREGDVARARAERAERELLRLKEAAEDGERQAERQFGELIDLAAKFKRAHTYGAAAGPSRV